MVEGMLDTQAAWLAERGADSDIVVNSQCCLMRNLADFPFPNQCNVDERRSVEHQVLHAIDSLNFNASGKYWTLDGMDPIEARFLAERRMISPALAVASGPRGAWIADDQSMSIIVNGENHLEFRALASGQQAQECWTRISVADDTLGSALDFAFDARLGYLTTAIHSLGTGLLTEVILHLPALVTRGAMVEVEQTVLEQRHRIEPVFGTVREPRGDLFRLSNTGSLGRSEEEIVFHLKHLASEIVGREREARQQSVTITPTQIEDRVWRAVGTARRARLLSFDEALESLSSLRLGVSLGQLDRYTIAQINDASIASQNAHIELRRGHDCDELTLNTERADFFRARFV